LVIVSISPVPKLEPGPVSYSHWESAPDPAAPVKSSLKTVDQPDGGAGTAAGATAEVAAAVFIKAAEDEAPCDVAATTATADTIAAKASASPPLRRHLAARLRLRVMRCDLPGIPGLLTPPLVDK
jgi:hypothetical protein